jgi:hypothetical protein
MDTRAGARHNPRVEGRESARGEADYGAHAIAFEPPDLIVVIVRGALCVEEMSDLAAFVRAHTTALGAVLLIADLSAMSALSATARRAAAETSRGIPYRGMALYGASFQTRVVAKLALGAMRLLGATSDCPIEFCQTEQEARAWVAKRRREIERR